MRSSSAAVGPFGREFATRSKLAVARDVAIILACAVLLIAFLAEIWGTATGPGPRAAPLPRSRPPAAMVAPTSAV